MKVLTIIKQVVIALFTVYIPTAAKKATPVIKHIVELKNMGKWTSTLVLVWTLWFFHQYAVHTNWSIEALSLMKDAIVRLTECIVLMVGASLGINKAIGTLKDK